MLKRFYYGSGAIAIEHQFDRNVQIEEVRLHLSAVGGGGTATISLVSDYSVNHNIVFKTQDMTSAADLHWQPTRPIFISKDDELSVAFANASSLQWGVEILYNGA